MIATPEKIRQRLLLREPRTLSRKTMSCHFEAFRTYVDWERFLKVSRHPRLVSVCYDKGVPQSIKDRIEEYVEMNANSAIGDDRAHLCWSFADNCLIHILMTALDHAALDFFMGDKSEFKVLHIVVASIRHHFADIVLFVVLHISKRRYGERRGTFEQDTARSHVALIIPSFFPSSFC